MSEIVRVEDLKKNFGALEVLKGINLNVKQGEVVAVLGPSGSGKSTLLRCLNYLEVPSGGRIFVRGQLVGQKVEGGKARPLPEHELNKQRAGIGMVFQRFNLFPHKTALGNIIEAPMTVLGVSKSDATAAAKPYLKKLVSPKSATSIRTVCPAASSSALRSRGPWRWNRRSCCSTKRRLPSTLSWLVKCLP